MTASLPSVLTLALLLSAGVCAAQDATSRFDDLDTNGDGGISKSEYDSKKLFSVLDTDRNYRISAEELQAFLGPQQDGAAPAADFIRLADMNGDGELNDEELRRRAEMRFQWLDTNQDGELDLPELKAGFRVPLAR